MQAGIYTLRNLTPLATIMVLMIATQPGWWGIQKRSTKILIAMILLFCILGAVTSGGRATMVFCIALTGVVALWRKKTLFILGSAMFGVIFLVVINIFSSTINQKAPYYVARSLQFLMIERGEAATAISGSRDIRKEAHLAALDECFSDTRVLIFGRSVYSLTHEEALYFRNTLGQDGFILNAIWSGRTHGLVTDLMLQYGIFGLFFYLSAYIMVFVYFWRLNKRISNEYHVSKALVGSMCIFMPMIIIYHILGGQYLPATVALVAGLIRADIHLRDSMQQLEILELDDKSAEH